MTSGSAFPAATPLKLKHDDGDATIVVSLQDDGEASMYAIEDGNGRAIFGFDLRPDGTVDVGHWDAAGEWTVGFSLGEPQPMPDNWVAHTAPEEAR